MKSNNKAFTLIELLAVIVILAIIALIATPIVLSIINESKESAQLRSAEMYLDAVEQSVAMEKLNNTTFNPNSCTIDKGNLNCDEYDKNPIEVKVNGEVPESGNITFTNGKIDEVTLTYTNGKTVVKEAGKLVYGDRSSSNLVMSTVSATLEDNDWETIQKVVKTGKVDEAGWSVGDTKTLEINGQEKEATIIGLHHDGENTATFMVMSNIGSHVMNSNAMNIGGWEASEMRAWLNGDIYDSMSNKDQIKEVTKMTDNIGYGQSEEKVASETQDKVFLLSVIEVGLQSIAGNDFDYPYMDAINAEGTTYEWFQSNSINSESFWLRSTDSSFGYNFFYSKRGSLNLHNVSDEEAVFAAFVIG